MKAIGVYINEKLVLNKDNVKNYQHNYNYHPKNKDELLQIIRRLIKERGLKANLNDIDTSNITDMSSLFINSSFNGDISQWDVSNVTNMDSMFGFSTFNGDISKWDVSNVENMKDMFEYSDFNGDINSWNTENLKHAYNMFDRCPLEKNPPIWYK